MKFQIIALAAALSAAAVVRAQAQQAPQQQRAHAEARGEQRDPAKRVERRVQMLTRQLNLSADQAARVNTILTQEGEQMKAFREKNRPATGAQAQRPTEEQRNAFRAQVQQIRQSTNGEMAKVLNADQLKKYQEFQSKRGDRDGRKGGEGRRGERGQTRQS
jgi:periplasmic protein CpxP/Spy